MKNQKDNKKKMKKSIPPKFPSSEIVMLESEGTHWYKSPTLDIWYPSVTTITSIFPKGLGFNYYLISQPSVEVAEENLKTAGERGTKIHNATLQLERGQTLCKELFSIQEWRMLMGFVNWYKEYKPVLVEAEYKVISDKMKLGGTIDRLYNINDVLVLLDIKTNPKIYPSHWLQVGAYAKMTEEKGLTLTSTAILRLTDKSKSGYQYETTTDWWRNADDFDSLRAIWDYLNPNAQPTFIELPKTLSLK